VTGNGNRQEAARKKETSNNDKNDCKVTYSALAAENSRDISTKLPYHDDLQNYSK